MRGHSILFQVINVFVLSLSLSFPALAKTYEFKFKRGAKFFFITNGPKMGLYRQDRDEAKLMVEGAPVQVPDANIIDDKNGEDGVRLLANSDNEGGLFYPEFAIAQVGKKALVLLRKGKVIELPASFNSAALSGDNLPMQTLDLRHNGQEYLFIRIAGSDPEGAGQLFIVREDGVVVQSFVSYSDLRFTRDEFQVRDGILTIKSSPRAIDLDRFEAEAEFASRVPARIPTPGVKDSKGNNVQDADVFEYVKSYYPDWTRDASITENAYEVSNQKTLAAIRKALLKKTIGNVVVLGDAGTGKTELVKSFIAGLVKGDYSEQPRTVSVLYVDGAGVASGTMYVGTGDSRVQALLEISKARPTILFMDEIHALRGKGTTAGDPNDIFEAMKPAMAAGQLHIVGTSTAVEFNNAFAGNTALYERFTTVTQDAFDRQKTVEALKSFSTRFKNPVPADNVLGRIIDLSSEFNSIGAQPRKAIRLLEEAQADMKLAGSKKAPTLNDVDQAAASLYGADRPEDRLPKLRSLLGELDKYIVGQDDAKMLLTRAAYQAYTGTHEPGKPRMRLAFVGKEGRGKTAMAIAYAKSMGLPYAVIEMNRYANSSGEDLLREVATALRKNAFTVLIFDEFEKAHVTAQEKLLGVYESGVFTVGESLDSGGRASNFVQVSARNASFILTTNAGRDVIHAASRKLGFRLESDRNEEPAPKKDSLDVRSALQKDGLSRYLIDRIDGIVMFKNFTREEYKEILRMGTRRFLEEQATHQNRKITLPVSEESFLEAVTEQTYHLEISARDALRALQERLRGWIAHAVVHELDFSQCEAQLGITAKTK